MAQGDTGIGPLPKRKDAANSARTTISRQTEEASSMMARKEAIESQKLREYMLQNKGTFSSQMKAKIKKLLRKDKTKKKRTILSPILGAVLKYHRDDDVDPKASGIKESAT